MALPKSRLVIDELALDRECISQPTLYMEAGEAQAYARAALDEATSSLSVIKAETMQRVRKHPEKFGLSEKPSETAIAGVIPTQTAVQDAEALVSKARFELDIATSFLTACEHRKRSLTLLVNLHSTNWFAEVKPSAAGKRAVEEDVKRTTRTLGQKKVRQEDDRD